LVFGVKGYPLDRRFSKFEEGDVDGVADYLIFLEISEHV